MRLRTSIHILIALAGLTITGCQAPGARPPQAQLEEQMISIQDLAARLGLRVDEQDASFVVLRNAQSTVLIFTHGDGRFFVNGKPIGPIGTVKRINGTLYVPEALASQIRPHLGVVLPERPPVTTKPLVVVDPGHGGQDPGAISPGGIREKDINLRVAAQLATLLQSRGVPVVMTRQSDRPIELEYRAEVANRRKAGLFVSIHSDSVANRDAQGFTVYVAQAASTESLRVARSIAKAMASTGLQSRGVRRANYRVLVETNGPAVLVELGYLSNASDVARLRDSAFQERLAAAVATGILNSLR